MVIPMPDSHEKCKSGKREVAGACLLFVAGMIVWLFLLEDVEKIRALAGVVTGLGSTVVLCSLAVFGLHHMKPPANKV